MMTPLARRMSLSMSLLAIAMNLAMWAQDEPWMPQPFNPGHRKPPENWHCFTNTPEVPAPDGHACDCHRQCYRDPGTGLFVIVEDQQCVVNCHQDHCKCVYTCDS